MGYPIAVPIGVHIKKHRSEQMTVKEWVTLKHGVTHWCTYSSTLILQYLDKLKIFVQCITYLLFINSQF